MRGEISRWAQHGGTVLGLLVGDDSGQRGLPDTGFSLDDHRTGGRARPLSAIAQEVRDAVQLRFTTQKLRWWRTWSA